jgi:general secretion pathway protein D
MKRFILALPLILAACAAPPAAMPAAPQASAAHPQALDQPAPAPVNVPLANGSLASAPTASYGPATSLTIPPTKATSTQGDITLSFADTDIRTVLDQILDTILQQNYTMLVRSNGLYRVMPADLAAATPSLASDDGLGGAVLIPLQYAQAAPLAQMLQPYVSNTAKIVAAADQNALIVEGDPASRQALVNLIEAFDVDRLAGQSYELFPVTGGDAADFAAAFISALGKSTDPSEPGPITVVPLERMNAVLVIARTQPLLSDAQRVYAVLNQVERETMRSWHVYYLHNDRANDAAYVLQQAFTPDNVTAQPSTPASGQPSTTMASNTTGTGSLGASSINSPILNTASPSNAASQSPDNASTTPSTDQSASSSASASALLGPLSASGTTATDDMRIIPDNDNNSLLIYATGAEDDRVSAMLDQIDSAPVEVRIDATIAEVDLTGALQYGTQFFFKSGGINAVLSEGTSAALTTNFPGFVLSGHGGDAAPLAISLLQSVTKVNVLSSPELMVLDGQSASLQVGELVPYLTQTSQSTLTTGSPVVNSIDYRETGVILHVSPHIGSDGMVTMDITQEVSGVDSSVTTTGINSPTFSDRSVTSRIAVQDDQTIGLAGLISDSDSHENQGIPYLKNVPLLGDLFSNQDNQRHREELLVLITPHVIRTQSGAAALTADLREALPNAAAVPASLSSMPDSQSADPDARLRSQIQP